MLYLLDIRIKRIHILSLMLDTEVIFYALPFGTRISDFKVKITIILVYFRNFNKVFLKGLSLNLRSNNFISCLLFATDLKFLCFTIVKNIGDPKIKLIDLEIKWSQFKLN